MAIKLNEIKSQRSLHISPRSRRLKGLQGRRVGTGSNYGTITHFTVKTTS